MHVYHYAGYEVTVLRRLMGRYGTREEEVDDLLRRGVFVDLLQGRPRRAPRLGAELRAEGDGGVPRLRRDCAEIKDGGTSIVEYER